jgi:tape measure domain-containing protein
MSSLGTVGGIVSRGLMPIAKITAAIGAAIGGVSIGVGGFGIKLSAEMEQTEIAFESMLRSAEKAKQVIGDLKGFSDVTPFEPDEVIAAGRSLIAFQEPVNQLVTTLTRVGNVSAGLKIPLGELTEIYGKARVNGRLMMEDINQLTGRGIPIIDELSKQFGVTEGEVRNLVSTGKVEFKNLEQAFIDLTSEGGMFFDLMGQQSKSALGLWSTIQGALKDIFRGIGDVLIKELDIKPAMAGMIEALRGFQQSFIPVFKAVIQITREFATVVIDATKWIAGMTSQIMGAAGPVGITMAAVAALAGGFTALAAAIVGTQAALMVLSKTTLPELIASTKIVLKSLKAFAASLWTLNTAVITLRVAIGGALITVVLALGAAFLKARADGLAFGDEMSSLADSVVLVYDRAKHLEIVQNKLHAATKRMAAAQNDVKNADTSEKQLAAQQELVKAIEDRIKALKTYSVISRPDAAEMSSQQWRMDQITLKKLTDQLHQAKYALNALQHQTKAGLDAGKLSEDAKKLTDIARNLKEEVDTFGMSDFQKLQYTMSKLKAPDSWKQFTASLQDDLDFKKGEQALGNLRIELGKIGMSGGELKLFDIDNLLFSTDQLKEAKRLIGDIQRKNVDQFISGKQKQVDLFGKSDAEKEIADLEGATDKQKQKVRSIFGELKRLSVGDYIAKLKIEVDENGLSDIERKLNDLRRQGADATQIAEARALLQQQQDANQPQQRIQTVGLTEMFNRIQTAIGPKDDPQKKTADNTKTVADETKKSNTKLDKLHTVLTSIDKKTATSVVGAGFVQ